MLKYTKTTLECNFERFSIFVFFVKEINSESIWTKSNLGFCQGTWVALRLYGTEAAEELFLPAPPFLGWRCRGKDRTWRPATLRKLAHQSSRRWFEHCLSTFGPILYYGLSKSDGRSFVCSCTFCISLLQHFKGFYEDKLLWWLLLSFVKN